MHKTNKEIQKRAANSELKCGIFGISIEIDIINDVNCSSSLSLKLVNIYFGEIFKFLIYQ